MPNNNDNYEYMKFLDLSGAQQIWNTCKQTFVRTVNGVGIDANGNCQVPGADALSIYPVGSIYMSVNSTSPASLFGGTWQQIKALTEIWANPNPNSSFSGQTLNNLPDLSQYQYLIFAYRQSVGSGYPIIYQKVKPYTFSNASYYTLCWFAQNTSIITQISRDIIFTSNTEIRIVDCYSDRQVYNAGLVPIAIYGTNAFDTDEIQYIWKRTA